LVTLVTPPVKSATLPVTLLAKFCTPPTTEAAKSAPGRVGSETRPPPVEREGALITVRPVPAVVPA
jgi:hypothetical protein